MEDSRIMRCSSKKSDCRRRDEFYHLKNQKSRYKRRIKNISRLKKPIPLIAELPQPMCLLLSSRLLLLTVLRTLYLLDLSVITIEILF